MKEVWKTIFEWVSDLVNKNRGHTKIFRMFKMSSDNVELLTYTSNIGALVSVFTPKVILSQYISLSIIGACDQNLSIVIQFSGDGTHYDYSITRSLPIGANDVISTPVYGKWMRMEIVNTGVVATTSLRLFVYGTPNNSSISAVISRIGNLDPEVSVYNSLPTTVFNELQTAEVTPKVQYIFNRGVDGTIITPLPTWSTPYKSIRMYDSSNDPLYPTSVKFYRGSMQFGRLAPFVLNSYQSCNGDLYSYRAGQGFLARFTACFTQYNKAVGGPKCRTQVCGVGNLDSLNSVQDAIGFGFDSSTNWNSGGYNGCMSIIWYQGGVRTTVPRSSWNVDRCDGSYVLPAMDFSKFQIYQIRYSYLGWGSLEWYIYSPSTGRFQLVHVINNVNTYGPSLQTNFVDPQMGLVLFQKVEAGCTPLSDEEDISISSFMMAVEGKDEIIQLPIAYESSKSILANTETPILAIRVLGSSWYTPLNHVSIDISGVGLSCDGTKNTTFRLYYGGTISGGSYSTPFITNQPIEVNTTFTYSNVGALPLQVYPLAKSSQIHIDLTQNSIHLNPKEYVVLTAISTGTSDVHCSISAVIG